MQRKQIVQAAAAVAVASLLAIVAFHTHFQPPIPTGQTEDTSCNLGKKNAAYVEGLLGGVNVRIPREYAENVEYDGDPSVLDRPTPLKNKCDEVPRRNISSFGFQFDFDSSGAFEAPNHQLRGALRQRFRVGFNAGERFTGAGEMNRMWETISRGSGGDFEKYKKTEEPVFDLTVYLDATNVTDPNPDIEKRRKDGLRDLFVFANENGTVTTVIKCSTTSSLLVPRCRHHFSLEPDLMVHAYASYPRQQLENWKKVEANIKSTVMSFTHPN